MQSADTIPACFATEGEYDRNLPPVWYHKTTLGPSSPAGQLRSTRPGLQGPRQQHHRACSTRLLGQIVHTHAGTCKAKQADLLLARAGNPPERRRRQGSSRHVQRLKRAPRVRVRPDSIKLSTIHSTRGSTSRRRHGMASQGRSHKGEGNGEGIGERGTCACGGSRITSPLALTCTVGEVRKRPGLGRTASPSCSEYSDDAADGTRRSIPIRRFGGVARPRNPDTLPELAPEPSRECALLTPARSGNCPA